MADIVRGLDLLIADLDTRQRQGTPSKNRPLQKIVSVSDVIGLGQDSQTIITALPPYHWHDPVGTTALSLIWALSEWG